MATQSQNELDAETAIEQSRQVATGVRLDAWRSVFEKTNRIMSQRPLRLRIVPGTEVAQLGMTEVPGWSDGETINFNGPLVRDMLSAKDGLSAVLRLKGLNYHELSHVLFTPRMSEELPKRVVEKAQSEGKSWWYAFNALEDQRIETWFTSSWGPSRRYFEAAILQWLIEDGNAEAAVLVYGRKYLSAKIRVQAEAVFVKKYDAALYAEFQAVIDDYLTLTFPMDSVRGWLLVTRYHALLMQMQARSGAPLPPLPIEDNGVSTSHGNGVPDRNDPTVTRTGRVSAKEAKEAKKRAEKSADEADKADEELRKQRAAAKKAGAEPTDEGEGEGSGDGEAEGEAEGEGAEGGAEGDTGQGDGDGGDGSAEGDSDSGSFGDGDAGEGHGGGGSSSGKGDHHVFDDEASLADEMQNLVDEARDGMAEIKGDADVQEDAARVLDAVKAVVNNGKQDADGAIAKKNGTRSANSEDLVAQRRVRTILTRIRQAVEPQVLRRQESGRLDVRRLLHRRPNETDIFTSYDEGMEDETGMEVVMLMDISGSMSGQQMSDASTSCWILKRAFDSLGIRCTVLAFDTDHYVIYQPGEKAKPRVPIISTMGGTDPTSALKQAHAILAKSHQASKVLITVTDGGWQDNERVTNGILRALHTMGAHTMLLGLGDAYKSYGKHAHLIGHDLQSVSELPKAVTKLVAGIMRAKTDQI